MDLVRHTPDPQVASKILVDHALVRFSTDNLSCMIVRFDGKAVSQNIDRKSSPIGVEGDPSSTKKGGISEADHLVEEARKNMGDAGVVAGEMDEAERGRVSREIIREEEEKETGPELDEEGLKNVTMKNG